MAKCRLTSLARFLEKVRGSAPIMVWMLAMACRIWVICTSPCSSSPGGPDEAIEREWQPTWLKKFRVFGGMFRKNTKTRVYTTTISTQLIFFYYSALMKIKFKFFHFIDNPRPRMPGLQGHWHSAKMGGDKQISPLFDGSTSNVSSTIEEK